MYQDGLIEIMQSNQVLLNLNSVHDIKGRIRLRWKDRIEEGDGDDGGSDEEEEEEKNDEVVLDGNDDDRNILD